MVGHARALDILLDLARSTQLLEMTALFDLHLAVQTAIALDTQCPVGAWKNSPNGTQTVDSSGRIRIIEYAAPMDVPALMQAWLADLNRALALGSDYQVASVYADLHLAFLRIHPFSDGNGRMARLLANLPILRAGLPPIVIPRERRADYIRLLASYDLEAGPAKAGVPALPLEGNCKPFRVFCRECGHVVGELIEDARKTQAARTGMG